MGLLGIALLAAVYSLFALIVDIVKYMYWRSIGKQYKAEILECVGTEPVQKSTRKSGLKNVYMIRIIDAPIDAYSQIAETIIGNAAPQYVIGNVVEVLFNVDDGKCYELRAAKRRALIKVWYFLITVAIFAIGFAIAVLNHK